MDRPNILLCPQFTELEWSIAPRLAEWAEVASYDVPGVGEEPLPAGESSRLDREMAVQRGLQEVESRGWDSYFVVGDAFGCATAARVARAHPEPVLGVALGHAALTLDMDGERAPVNGEVCAAMTQLLRTDYDSFVRFGITQFTQGGYDEEISGQMVARFPESDLAAEVWEMLLHQGEPIGEMLRVVGKPLLLGKHEGCLVFGPEGYEDAVAAFPEASTVVVDKTSGGSEEFAEALREFCESVLARA
jgi:pimeloyl-ACP methyl ester carboxylesterase